MPELGSQGFSDVPSSEHAPRVSPLALPLAFVDTVLSAVAVQRIEQALRELRNREPVAIDCQRLRTVSASGLSALLELGRSNGGLRELALTTLSRELTLVAIEAGLSERFSIYATSAAWSKALERRAVSPCAP